MEPCNILMPESLDQVCQDHQGSRRPTKRIRIRRVRGAGRSEGCSVQIWRGECLICHLPPLTLISRPQSVAGRTVRISVAEPRKSFSSRSLQVLISFQRKIVPTQGTSAIGHARARFQMLAATDGVRIVALGLGPTEALTMLPKRAASAADVAADSRCQKANLATLATGIAKVH